MRQTPGAGDACQELAPQGTSFAPVTAILAQPADCLGLQRGRLRRSRSACHNFRGRHGLPDVPQRVLGPVEQQADDGGRQLRPTDSPRLRERRLASRTQLRQRTVNGVGEPGEQTLGGARIGIRLALRGKGRLLIGREPLPACIGEETVEAAAGVARVESHGRSTGRTRPDLLGREPFERALQFLTGLEKAVRNGLQERQHARDGAAKPDFRLTRRGHEATMMTETHDFVHKRAATARSGLAPTCEHSERGVTASR
jgi:hypothetical protein